MANLISTYMAYRFIKILTTPWNKQDAFVLGLIDKDGKKIKSPETEEEKEAYDHFNRLVFNVKRIVSSAPGGKSKIASYGAALLLLKEGFGKELEDIDMFDRLLHGYLAIDEETPTNVSSDVAMKDLPFKKKKKEEKQCDEYCAENYIRECMLYMDEDIADILESKMDLAIGMAKGYGGFNEENLIKAITYVLEGKIRKKVIRQGKVKVKFTCSGENQIMKMGHCVPRDAGFTRKQRAATRKRKKTTGNFATYRRGVVTRKRERSARKSTRLSGGSLFELVRNEAKLNDIINEAKKPEDLTKDDITHMIQSDVSALKLTPKQWDIFYSIIQMAEKLKIDLKPVPKSTMSGYLAWKKNK